MLYAEAGVTLAHEGATHADELAVMQRATAVGANIIDVVAYPFMTDLEKIVATNPVANWGKYDRHFKIGGVKVTIDGSPQGKTAYFTTPYLTGGPGGEKNWRGEPTIPQEMINKLVKHVYDMNVPLILHATATAPSTPSSRPTSTRARATSAGPGTSRPSTRSSSARTNSRSS